MDLAVWRDISLMWLIFLALIAVLPVAALFFFAIKGMHRLRQLTTRYLPIAQEKARLVANTTDQVSLKVTRPITDMRSRAAQADGIRKATFRRKQA